MELILQLAFDLLFLPLIWYYGQKISSSVHLVAHSVANNGTSYTADDIAGVEARVGVLLARVDGLDGRVDSVNESLTRYRNQQSAIKSRETQPEPSPPVPVAELLPQVMEQFRSRATNGGPDAS